MIHKAYKKGTIAKYYYKIVRKKDFSNQSALVQFNKDLHIDWNIVQDVISQIFEEQKKLF
jgi:putative cell wall-binding protein